VSLKQTPQLCYPCSAKQSGNNFNLSGLHEQQQRFNLMKKNFSIISEYMKEKYDREPRLPYCKKLPLQLWQK
jgi:hypothetical protein